MKLIVAILAYLGTTNAEETSKEILGAPNYDIDFSWNPDVAKDGVRELMDEYNEWNEKAMHIFEDWMTDNQLINDYYWRYEVAPHLQEGAKLDEKTLRSIVTYIANSTEINGKPLTEAYPGVEEWMMKNYDPEGPTIYEKFCLMNL